MLVIAVSLMQLCSEFVICFSGFLIPSEDFAAPPGMRTPALLVQGEHDTLILPEWTKYLYDRFDKENGDVKLELHAGGMLAVICYTLKTRHSLTSSIYRALRPAQAALEVVPLEIHS